MMADRLEHMIEKHTDALAHYERVLEENDNPDMKWYFEGKVESHKLFLNDLKWINK